MGQAREPAQNIDVGQLRDVVGGQDEVLEVRDGGGQSGLDGGDAILRQQQGLDARRQREVPQHLDIVVGEVYGILGLFSGESVSQPSWSRARGSPL